MTLDNLKAQPLYDVTVRCADGKFGTLVGVDQDSACAVVYVLDEETHRFVPAARIELTASGPLVEQEPA